MSIFDKWNKSFDGEALKKDVADAAKGGSREFEEVPKGEYEVRVEKIELKECGSQRHKGEPMGCIWFKILNGKYKNSMIFMNQLVSEGFQIHIFNEFLRSLDTGVEIEFDGNFNSYNDTILDVFEGTQKFEYALEYGENSKGFNTYKIIDIFVA